MSFFGVFFLLRPTRQHEHAVGSLEVSRTKIKSHSISSRDSNEQFSGKKNLPPGVFLGEDTKNKQFSTSKNAARGVPRNHRIVVLCWTRRTPRAPQDSTGLLPRLTLPGLSQDFLSTARRVPFKTARKAFWIFFGEDETAKHLFLRLKGLPERRFYFFRSATPGTAIFPAPRNFLTANVFLLWKPQNTRMVNVHVLDHIKSVAIWAQRVLVSLLGNRSSGVRTSGGP